PAAGLHARVTNGEGRPFGPAFARPAESRRLRRDVRDARVPVAEGPAGVPARAERHGSDVFGERAALADELGGGPDRASVLVGCAVVAPACPDVRRDGRVVLVLR